MTEANIIREHMELVGSDGGHVGTVDKVEGDRIKLTKAESGEGAHHYVATALVQDIKGNTVTLTVDGHTAVASEE